MSAQWASILDKAGSSSGTLRGSRLSAVALLACAIYGCAPFREELPEILYSAELIEPADMRTCDELSHDMAAQEGLIVTTYVDPLLPNSSCSATLRTAGNGIEVDIDRAGQTLDITVHRHTRYGAVQPDAATEDLADALVRILKARYPKSDFKRVKVYSNPFFGP